MPAVLLCALQTKRRVSHILSRQASNYLRSFFQPLVQPRSGLSRSSSKAKLPMHFWRYLPLAANLIALHSTVAMGYPSKEDVYNYFKLFESPLGDSRTQFFDRWADDIVFHIPGHGPFAATYNGKDAYMKGGFSKLSQAIKDPGFTFKITNGLDGVSASPDGRAAVMFDTVDTYQKNGTLYDQHYCWFLRFDDGGCLKEAWAFLDLGYLDDTLGAQLRSMGIAT